MKLSKKAAEMLILINDHSELPDGRFWVPPRGYKQSWSETLGRHLFIDGSGCAMALKGLERKGLIVFKPLVAYASQVTPAGRELVAKWVAGEEKCPISLRTT